MAKSRPDEKFTLSEVETSTESNVNPGGVTLQMKKSFPSSFLFGASTAAHQVEGGNFNNDWWQFEQQGKIRDGSSARVACDHYRLFDQDFAMAKSLGHTAHRLSLEWSRLESKPGKFSQKETAHYLEVLKSLKKHRLTSFVTLQHFTLPLWFSRQGGWTNPDSPAIFSRYASYCATNFSHLIDFWLTVNEPQALIVEGYLRGRFPPERRNPLLALKAAKNIMRAHNMAYREIHRHLKTAKISFTTIHNYFEPKLLMEFSDWFLDQAKGHLDFIGLDYYHHYRLQLVPPRRRAFAHLRGVRGLSPQRVKELPLPWRQKLLTSPREWVNTFSRGGGWLTELPQETGILPLLHHLKHYRLPIFITENGAFDSDQARAKLIKKILREILKALAESIDIRGYLHWTLMDNFEWFHGKSVRMGLCETDYTTLERTPRPSARIFRQIIKEKKINFTP